RSSRPTLPSLRPTEPGRILGPSGLVPETIGGGGPAKQHAIADSEVGILRGFDSRRLRSPCKSHFPLGTVSLAGPRLPGRSRGRLCRGRRQTRSIRTLFGPLERLILTLIGGSCSESRFSACPRLSKPNVSASFTATSSRLTI